MSFFRFSEQPAIVSMLYSGIQCSSCGVRFPPEQTVKYSQHLDWHFRQNRRDKDSQRKPQSRKWYYDVSDWIQFEEIEDFDERGAWSCNLNIDSLLRLCRCTFRLHGRIPPIDFIFESSFSDLGRIRSGNRKWDQWIFSKTSHGLKLDPDLYRRAFCVFLVVAVRNILLSRINKNN